MCGWMRLDLDFKEHVWLLGNSIRVRFHIILWLMGQADSWCGRIRLIAFCLVPIELLPTVTLLIRLVHITYSASYFMNVACRCSSYESCTCLCCRSNIYYWPKTGFRRSDSYWISREKWGYFDWREYDCTFWFGCLQSSIWCYSSRIYYCNCNREGYLLSSFQRISSRYSIVLTWLFNK